MLVSDVRDYHLASPGERFYMQRRARRRRRQEWDADAGLSAYAAGESAAGAAAGTNAMQVFHQALPSILTGVSVWAITRILDRMFFDSPGGRR
jgi:hypothetical protein